jgi:hypothetical protein
MKAPVNQPMLTGKRFQLQRPTLAIEEMDGRRTAVTLPSGAIVTVVCGPTGPGDRMVDVLWEGRTVTMFEVDVNIRGAQLAEKSAKA